jgi:hypothetical protein
VDVSSSSACLGHGLACIHLRLSADRPTALVEVQDENLKLPEPNQPGLDDETVRTGQAPHTPLQWT